MNITSCKIGYIYSLSYKGTIFYIGQTTLTLQKRLYGHKTKCFLPKDKYVYQYIRTITTKDMFYNDIVIKPIRVCSIYELDNIEFKCIKYCIDKGLKLYNNCSKTILYKSKNN